LTHPFPCALDGLVVGVVGLLAGGDGLTALRLGVAMTALQASIGALNDVVDAPHDATSKREKPIPGGLVSSGLARLVIVLAAGAGLALSVPSGGLVAVLALVVLAIGFGYDLGFKGTAWSWLPFALGIPLLPVFGWLGVSGSVPPAFAVLVPVAFVAGAALAVANARADAGRDAAAGVDSVAVRLGPRRAEAVNAVLVVAALLAAIVTRIPAGRGSPGPLIAVMGASLVVAAGLAIGHDGGSQRLERAWELESVGFGLLAAAWLAGAGPGG
jgi:4-hydroxybenzoate polyprenyltransferase